MLIGESDCIKSELEMWFYNPQQHCHSQYKVIRLGLRFSHLSQAR
jgi:hypothetical protein